MSVVPTTGTAPLLVAFDGSSSSDPAGTITSWDLSFGDSTADATGSGPPPAGVAHTYATAGTYTATLTVTGDDGVTGMSQATVVVSAPQPSPPTARLAVAPGSGAAPLPVSFDGSASSDPDGTITSWSLDFGDGTAAENNVAGTPPAGIAHTYTTAGTYTATLSVTDSNGQSGTATAQIVVAVTRPRPSSRRPRGPERRRCR